MEASVAGAAPAGAEAAQTAPLAPTGVPTPEATPENDVQAQLQAMQARIDELQGAGQTDPADFVSELTNPADLAFSPEEMAQLQAGQDPNQAEQGQVDQQAQAEFDAYMKGLVQEATQPLVQERQMEQLEAFVKDHPDIQNEDIREPVIATMRGLAERYGEGAEMDTNLLQLAYASVKAGMADAAAVPAEQAASHGASIETQAGQTQTGETSVEEQYVNQLRASAPGNDVFSR